MSHYYYVENAWESMTFKIGLVNISIHFYVVVPVLGMRFVQIR